MENDSHTDLLSILTLPYQKIFNSMPAYALILGRDYRIIEGNSRFQKDFGEGKGRYCYKAAKGLDGPCDSCPVNSTFSTGEEHTAEHTWIKENGDKMIVQVNTVPIKNSDGQVAAVMEMAVDITRSFKLKQELENSEKRFRELFEAVPCYISIQDKNLRIVGTNQAFRDDFSGEEGGFCYEVYKHRDEPCMVCPVLASFRDGKDHLREEVVTNNRGEKVNVLVHSHPIKNESGDVEYVMEMSSDITQIRQLQDQLQSLGLLVGSISHGIKGVITALDGGIYLMNSGFDKENMGRVRKGWDMVQRNVSRIRSMVMDVLYYAKDREPNWEAVNPQQVLTEVCDLLETKAKEQKITFERKFEQGISDFEADSKAIHSMLVNIIENSIDACRTDKTKADHHIEVILRSDPDHVFFEVKDNGTGMDQETRERLFSLFFSSKGTEGTGLGLFISNKIAQKHGGIIVVDSEVGKGSHFSIRIPKRIPEDMKKPQLNNSVPTYFAKSDNDSGPS